jgi:hypothetical protein
MKKIIISLLIILSLAGVIKVYAEDNQFDKYGGWIGLKGTQKGYFHTEKLNDKWWIITPEGNVFWTIGMYCVRMGGIPDSEGKRTYQESCLNKYGSEQEWIKATRMQLHNWGFNTIGDWSTEGIYREPGIAYLIGIDLSRKAENVIPKGSYGYFPDVFSQGFKDGSKEAIEGTLKNQPYLIDDPWLLGYFLADEPSWYGSKGRRGSLVDDFIALDNAKPGKQAWLEFIKNKGLNENQASEQDKLEFLEVIAEQFAKVLHDTLREIDKYHMILGTRPTRSYPEVIRGTGKYCDIFSMSAYGLNQGYKIDPKFSDEIDEVASYAGKPIMLGVLIAAQDTGLPYGVVRTQKDRGISYWRYLAKTAAHPAVVGMHWFQYFDPPRKCYDEQAANWGLVNDKDEPYEEAVNSIAQANKMVYAYALGLSTFVPEFDNFLAPKKQEPPADNKTSQKSVPIPIPNGNFEDGQQKWSFQTWKGQSKASLDNKTKRSGKSSLKIQGGPGAGWDSVGVAVQNPGVTLKPGYTYKLSAWIKTKGVEDSAFVRIKANYQSGEAVYFGTEGAYGTEDWKLVEVTFSPREENKVEYLGAQLVGKGTAWIDDIKLELIE